MSLREDLARIQARIGDDPRLHQKSLWEELGGVPGDIAWGFGSMLGMEKSADQILRERKYPVTTFLAGAAGYAVPYTGLFKAVNSIKSFDKAVKGMEWMGKAAQSPIKTEMLRTAARIGGTEAARAGASLAIPGGEDIGETLAHSGMNIAFGTTLSGGLSALASGGARRAPLQEIFKDIDLNQSPQVQFRQLTEAITQGKIDPKHTNEARNRLASLGAQVRTQRPPRDVPYVDETLKGGGKRLNRIFSTDGKKVSGLTRRRFARTEDGFINDAAWQDALKRAGVPDDWMAWTQYPRHISFRTDSAAKQIQNTVYQTMQSAGDGWYLTRELNDGLFVLAKKVGGEGATKPSVKDEWLFMKTDAPARFRPSHADWQQATADHMLFMAKAPRPSGPINDIYDSAKAMIDTLPLRKYVGAAAGGVGEMSARMAKSMGVDKALANTGEVTQRVKDFFVEHLAPTVQQFGRSPRAGRTFGIAQATYDAAEAQARRIAHGERALDPKKSPLTHVLGKPIDPSGPSARGLVDPLSDEEVRQLWQIVRSQSNLEAVEEAFAQGKITQAVRDAAKGLDDIDRDISAQVVKVEEATGGGKFKPKEGHYMMTHRWEGDNRIAIRDAEDRLYAVAAGQSRDGAKREANKLLAKYAEEGNTDLRIAEEFDITTPGVLAQDLRAHVMSPAWTLERQGVRGHKFDDTPFTKKELLDELELNIRRRMKYMANRTVDDLLADDIARVAVEDPTMHRILVGRLNDLAGARTPLAKATDAAVDQVLGPVLGGNSASKLVSATNKAMWHLELGAMRLAYPAMNALTFLQTTMPEIAFVQTANKDILGKFYDVFTMQGKTMVRPRGILNPIKLMHQGTKQMGSKDPQFMKGVERAINEAVIDPRFIEESTGKIGKVALSNPLKNPGGMVEWVEAVSEYLPAQSEKFSRLQSFSTGWVVGKDLLGIADDELLYRFAKQFTDRTMFRYGMDARPRVFTTPAGSLLGLFKNWMMHYTGMMLDYTAEGAMRGNWAPLIWQTLGTGAVGGVTAMPLWTLANSMSEAMSGKSALVNGYELFEPAGDGVSDAIFFGLPTLLGASLSGSATAPFNNPMRDVTQMMSLVHWDRVQAAGRFFGGAMDHAIATGEGPFEDPNTRDMFFRAFTPKTIYRTASTLEDGVINSLSTGNPVLKDVGVGDKILFSLGFNPTKIEKAYAVREELWSDNNKMKKAVQRYGEALAQAYERNDMREVEVIVQRALVDGVDISSIERSALSRIAKSEADVITRQFKPEEIEKRMAVLGDDYKGLERE